MKQMLRELQLLQKLVSFDTQNSDDVSKVRSTDEALDFVANLLEDYGLIVEFQEYTIGNGDKSKPRRNLLARIIVFGVGNGSMSHTGLEFVEISDLPKYTQKLLEFIR